MNPQPLVTNFLVLLFYLHVTTAADDFYSLEFFPRELSHKSDVDFFLTGTSSTVNLYAFARVFLCTSKTAQFTLGSCESKITVDYIMARTRQDPVHGVWFRFEADAVAGIATHAAIKATMKFDYSKNHFFGARVVRGPQGERMKLADPAALLTLHHKANYVFMFAEGPRATQSFYTREQIGEMSKLAKNYSGNATIYVAFDSFYLSKTEIGVLNFGENFPNVGVLFYCMDGQEKPEFYEIKERIKVIAKEKVLGMRFFTKDDLRIRFMSNVPTVEWQNFADQRQTIAEGECESPIDSATLLYDFIANPRQMRRVLVGDFNLDMYKIFTNQYPADLLLQKLEDGRGPLLIEFRNNETIARITFDRYYGRPFVVLPVIDGPNRPWGKKAADIKKIVNKTSTAYYVIGFSEATEGAVQGYSEEHIKHLVDAFKHPVVKGRKLGVRFQAQHLSQDKMGHLKQLCEATSFKWAFIMDGCGKYSPSNDQMRNLKYNLNQLCHRKIYLFLDEKIRREIFVDETVIDPFPPSTFTTPTTTTAMTPPTTVTFTRTFPTKTSGVKGMRLSGIICLTWLGIAIWRI